MLHSKTENLVYLWLLDGIVVFEETLNNAFRTLSHDHNDDSYLTVYINYTSISDNLVTEAWGGIPDVFKEGSVFLSINIESQSQKEMFVCKKMVVYQFTYPW